MELQNNLKVGDKFVDFSMKNREGIDVNLSDYEGKLILLDFWASWCVPCIKEFHLYSINTTYVRYTRSLIMERAIIIRSTQVFMLKLKETAKHTLYAQ